MLKAIKNRFSGEIAQNFGTSMKNLLTGRFDTYIDIAPIISFFFGWTTGYNFVARRVPAIYEEILKKYSEGDHVNFAGIRVPKPSNAGPEELRMFVGEFLDIINPVLSGHPNYLGEGPYEYGDVKIEKGDVVIDAGANMGMFAALAASKGAVVYAFEPVEKIRKTYLAKTAQMNPDIRIVPMALADKNGLADMHLDEKNSAAASMIFKKNGGVEKDVQCTTLDSFVEQNAISRVDFIKMDIEGAERLMLAGAQNVLKRHAPKLSICTYHLPDDKEALSALIRQLNPAYDIRLRWQKLYAAVSGRGNRPA